VVGSIDTPLAALSIEVSGNRLLVDGGMNSIYCIDVSQPDSPILIGSLSNDEFNRRPQGFIDGCLSRQGYLSDGSTVNSNILVVNVENRSDPVCETTPRAPDLSLLAQGVGH
jgi:hypothetical protein